MLSSIFRRNIFLHNKKNGQWLTSETERSQIHYARRISNRASSNSSSMVSTPSPFSNSSNINNNSSGNSNNISSSSSSIAPYISCLEADDETGYTTNDPEKLHRAQSLSDSGQEGAIFGPTPVENLLPWLSAPGNKKTYLTQAEVSFGRKERWHRVVSDSQMRRKLVDLLWMYICDAEKQTSQIDKQTKKLEQRAKKRSEEFSLFIKKMHDDKDIVEAFFEWPDPDNDVDDQVSTSTSTSLINKKSGGEQEEDQNNKKERNINIPERPGYLLKQLRKQSVGAIGGDITSDNPLAPYEELPFLRQRLQEDPSSLDENLKQWAKMNFKIEQQQQRERELEQQQNSKIIINDQEDIHQKENTNNDSLVNEIAREAGLDVADTQQTQQQQQHDENVDENILQQQQQQDQQKENRQKILEQRKLQRKVRKIQNSEVSNALYLPLKMRVTKRQPTFDEDGVYFHVATTAPSSSSSHQEEQENISEMMTMDSSSSNNILKKFFKPKMVKASDDTSRGVVKVDWPTVRAAYGSRNKTDLAKEEVAAAKERIIRLCRGEDPGKI